MSQSDTLLLALRRGEALTVAEAMSRYGVYALSQRMGELRRAGHPIRAEMVTVATGKRVARYAWTGQLELAA